MRLHCRDPRAPKTGVSANPEGRGLGISPNFGNPPPNVLLSLFEHWKLVGTTAAPKTWTRLVPERPLHKHETKLAHSLPSTIRVPKQAATGPYEECLQP